MTYEEKRKLISAYRKQCGRCLVRRASEVHEIRPRSAGGKLIPTNQIPLCQYCHSLVHGEGWQNHHNELIKCQRKAQRMLNPKIEVGEIDTDLPCGEIELLGV